MKILITSRLKKVSPFLFLAAFAAVTAFYFTYKKNCEGVVSYQSERDRASLLKLFTDNWYWLVPEESSFTAEAFLRKSGQAYNPHDPFDHMKSKIMVYCHEGRPIGFVSYHKESFYKGRLRFIVIDSNYRGKGYSEKLINYALDDMKKMGCIVVKLVTRTNNEAARNLYKRLGFTVLSEDNGFIWYSKELNPQKAYSGRHAYS